MGRILERRSDSTGRVALDIAVELRDTAFEDSFEADCVNLSTGGLSLRSPCLPDVGTSLECRFGAVDNGASVTARGEVVWAQLDGERGGEFGLRFVDVNPTTELLIEEMLAEYFARRPGELSEGAQRVVQLELEGTSEAITAEVARDGRGMATFEQKLDLLKLGRGICARKLGGHDRRGQIASVELKLVGNTPMLAVTVDFEAPDYGEFEWPDPAEEQDPDHDTEPDLEAPESPRVMADAPVDRFSHTTETEFAPPARAEAPPADEPEPAIRVRAVSETELPAALAEAPADPPPPRSVDAAPPVAEEARAAEAEAPAHDEDWPVPLHGAPSEEQAPRERAARAPSAALDDAPSLRLDESPGASASDAVPPLAATAIAHARRLWLRGTAVALQVAAVVSRVGGEGLRRLSPRLRGGLIRLRGLGHSLYRQHLATGLGAARRLVSPRLPRRRRRTAAPTTNRARPGRNLPLRPLAMGAMGVAALGLAAYALMPSSGSEIPLHRAVQPAAPAPVQASAEAAIAAATPEAPTGHAGSPAVAPPAPTPKPPSVASTPPGLLFGASQVENARSYTLRMSARIGKLKGIPDKGGFTVIIPGSLSLDRAGPISASHRAVRRSMILNKGDRSELTIRFVEGKRPAYQVRADGDKLQILIQDV